MKLLIYDTTENWWYKSTLVLIKGKKIIKIIGKHLHGDTEKEWINFDKVVIIGKVSHNTHLIPKEIFESYLNWLNK